MKATAVGLVISAAQTTNEKEIGGRQLSVQQIITLCRAAGILRSLRQRALHVSFIRWHDKKTRSRLSLSASVQEPVSSRQLSIDFSNMNISETKLTPKSHHSGPQSRHRSLIVDAESLRKLNDQTKLDELTSPRRRSVTKHSSMSRRGSVILMDTLPILDTNLGDAKNLEPSPLRKLSPNGLGVDPDLNDISNLSYSLSRAQIRLRWREAVKKIKQLRRITAERESKQAEKASESSERSEQGAMCSRPIDYFIVFGVHPPKEFRDVDFQHWNESQIESILRRAQAYIYMDFSTFLQLKGVTDILAKTIKIVHYTPKAICIVSQYPHLATYRKILSQLYSVASSQSYHIPVERFISQFTMELPLPVPDKMGVSMIIHDNNDPIELYASPLRDPLISRLPLNLLFNILTVDSVLGVFSAMMFEQRILLHSNSLSALTIVCQTMLQLLYPFQWSSVYVPVLAELMLDAYQCPQPYIQGVHTKYLSQFTDLNDIVLVDLDHDLIRCSSPLPRLPQQAGSALWTRLGEIMERRSSERDYVLLGSEDPYNQSPSAKFDKDVMNAFLMFHADLMTGFRRFLFFINDVPFFNGTGFLKSKNLEDGSYEFMAKVIESRAFDGFLEQESEPSLYNDFLATGDARILEKIHEIEGRKVECYQMKLPKSVPESKWSQSEHAFIKPLRLDLMHPVQRVPLAPAQNKMTASTRKIHKKRPQQDALAGQHDQMQYYMSQIFSNEGLSEKDALSVSHLLRHESARTCLSSILKQPLVKGSDLCLSDSSFAALAATLQQMLECCLQVEDYVNAASVLDASTRFFCEDYSGGKIFIESVIRDHSMWTKEAFWEKFTEFALLKTDANVNKHQENTANWLMNTSHKMLTLGLSPESVTQTVIRIAKLHDLPLQRIDELKKLIINAAQAMAAVD